MKIIEDYLQLENAALRLIKTGKNADDRLPNEKNKLEGNINDKNLNQNDFDYDEYYKKQGFDPRAEIIKERKIYDFFKEKYRLESAGLAEDNLKEFLNENEDSANKKEFAFLPKESNEGTSHKKGNDVNIMVIFVNKKNIDKNKGICIKTNGND